MLDLHRLFASIYGITNVDGEQDIDWYGEQDIQTLIYGITVSKNIVPIFAFQHFIFFF